MLVLIDESGCPGFKFLSGSTRYFIIGMVIFKTFEDAEKTSSVITNVRNRLNSRTEFRFSKTSKEYREAFFGGISGCNFSVRILIVDKLQINSHELSTKPKVFYNYFLQLLLKHDNNIIKKAHLKIDGSGNRNFRDACASYLRKQLAADKIKKLSFANSAQDNLIQLADMCVGAVAYSLNHPEDVNRTRWQKMLGKKLENIWNFK